MPSSPAQLSAQLSDSSSSRTSLPVGQSQLSQSFQSFQSSQLKPSPIDVKLNRLKAKRAVLLNREEIATQQDRRRRTRTLIQLGGLLSVVGLTDQFGIVLGDDLQRTDDGEGEGDGKDDLNKQGYATQVRDGNSQGTQNNQANQDKAATLLGLLLSVIEQLPETVDTEALKQKGIRFLKRRSAERHY